MLVRQYWYWYNTPSQKLDVGYIVSSKLLVGSGVYSASSPGSYFGLKHTGLAGSAEYMIMSAGTHTYLSAKVVMFIFAEEVIRLIIR